MHMDYAFLGACSLLFGLTWSFPENSCVVSMPFISFLPFTLLVWDCGSSLRKWYLHLTFPFYGTICQGKNMVASCNICDVTLASWAVSPQIMLVLCTIQLTCWERELESLAKCKAYLKSYARAVWRVAFASSSTVHSSALLLHLCQVHEPLLDFEVKTHVPFLVTYLMMCSI